MAITLEVTPEVEALLHLQATQSGQGVSAYLLRLVERDLQLDTAEHPSLEDFALSVAAVQEGFRDDEAGRTVSLEEAFDQLEEEKVKWRREQRAKSRDVQTVGAA